jgi:hypothetical protein
VTTRGPANNDGPRRFIRNWLSFDDRGPLRLRRMTLLIATIALLLIATALLAWFGNRLPH